MAFKALPKFMALVMPLRCVVICILVTSKDVQGALSKMDTQVSDSSSKNFSKAYLIRAAPRASD